jgi:hypothetical protein
MKRTYFVKTTNGCADLNACAINFDTISRVKLQIENEAGRQAYIRFDWEWIVDDTSFKLDIYGDAIWALPYLGDILAHLADLTTVRPVPTVDQLVGLLKSCNVKHDPTEPTTVYIGRDRSAA